MRISSRFVPFFSQFAWFHSQPSTQCSVPVFEGLLPEPHNTHILMLLHHFGHWHGLAKLRLHTDETLDILDDLTTILGDDLRTFKADTCASFQTKELQKEANARQRRQVKASSVVGTETKATSKCVPLA